MAAVERLMGKWEKEIQTSGHRLKAITGLIVGWEERTNLDIARGQHIALCEVVRALKEALASVDEGGEMMERVKTHLSHEQQVEFAALLSEARRHVAAARKELSRARAIVWEAGAGKESIETLLHIYVDELSRIEQGYGEMPGIAAIARRAAAELAEVER